MIYLTITEATLTTCRTKAGKEPACKAGLAFWRSLARPGPKGVLRVRLRWTQAEMLKWAKEQPAFWAWLRDEGIAPSVSIARADLSWADLARANLSWADLSGANLSWANLARADLARANLSWANLYGADLARANLSWADLSGANLARADLSGANLARADLSGADLSGADLGDWKRDDTTGYAGHK